MYRNTIFLLTAIVLLTSSCAKVSQISETPSRTTTHQTIAILPPQVTIHTREKPKDLEVRKRRQNSRSKSIQLEMCRWLLHKKKQQRILVNFQNPDTTNKKLEQIGYFNENTHSPQKIAELLGVDAIITSKYRFHELQSRRWATPECLTDLVSTNVEIHDKTTKKVLWDYKHQVYGNPNSSLIRIAHQLSQSAIRKMPYYN